MLCLDQQMSGPTLQVLQQQSGQPRYGVLNLLKSYACSSHHVCALFTYVRMHAGDDMGRPPGQVHW